jgi:hypothetical protein
MPRMTAAVYAAYVDNVLKLAQREGGVSRPQIISELNVSNAVATKLVKDADLGLDHKDGRTQFFKPTEASPVAVKQSRPELPPAVKEAVVPESADTGEGEDEDEIAEVDAEIADTKQALREAAAALGKAAGQWAMHDAVVESLRARMVKLINRRMNASS